MTAKDSSRLQKLESNVSDLKEGLKNTLDEFRDNDNELSAEMKKTNLNMTETNTALLLLQEQQKNVAMKIDDGFKDLKTETILRIDKIEIIQEKEFARQRAEITENTKRSKSNAKGVSKIKGFFAAIGSLMAIAGIVFGIVKVFA